MRGSVIGPFAASWPTSLSPVEVIIFIPDRFEPFFIGCRGRLDYGVPMPAMDHVSMIFATRFAVKTLVNWYRSGQNVDQCLPVLSTYLGHGNVSDTYWYLTACPELLGLAVKRFERHWEGPQ